MLIYPLKSAPAGRPVYNRTMLWLVNTLFATNELLGEDDCSEYIRQHVNDDYYALPCILPCIFPCILYQRSWWTKHVPLTPLSVDISSKLMSFSCQFKQYSMLCVFKYTYNDATIITSLPKIGQLPVVVTSCINICVICYTLCYMLYTTNKRPDLTNMWILWMCTLRYVTAHPVAWRLQYIHWNVHKLEQQCK